MITVNGADREVEAGTTVAGLVTALLTERGTPDATRGIAVAVDGSVVPRTVRAGMPVTDGMRVEIVTAVQGG